MHRHAVSFLVLSFLAVFVSSVSAGWKDDIGYTDLEVELGAAIPTGSSVTASMVEASTDDNSPYYAPDTAHAQFTGKTITLMSGASGTSWHATTVGTYLFGNTSSIAGGIVDIDSWLADDWIGAGFLKTASSLNRPWRPRMYRIIAGLVLWGALRWMST